MTFFFYGPNTFALREQVEQMATAFVAKTGSNMGYERLDGATARPDTLRAALQAAPFLSTSRLVVIDGLGGNKAVFDKLGDVLGLVPKSTVAVFVDAAIDKRTAAYKALSAADKVVAFEPLAPPQLAAWAKRRIESYGGEAGRGAVPELLKAAGTDQWRLDGEISKLVSFSPEVTVQSVREMVSATVEQSVFTLTDSMVSGRVREALTTFMALMERRENPLGLLALIQGQLRNLLLAKAAGNLPVSEFARAAGLKPYPAEKAMGTARRLDAPVVEAVFVAAVECEFRIKTGAQAPEAALEDLVARISLMTARP